MNVQKRRRLNHFPGLSLGLPRLSRWIDQVQANIVKKQDSMILAVPRRPGLLCQPTVASLRVGAARTGKGRHVRGINVIV